MHIQKPKTPGKLNFVRKSDYLFDERYHGTVPSYTFALANAVSPTTPKAASEREEGRKKNGIVGPRRHLRCEIGSPPGAPRRLVVLFCRRSRRDPPQVGGGGSGDADAPAQRGVGGAPGILHHPRWQQCFLMELQAHVQFK